MIALARSPKMKRWIQGSRATSTIATRYVAGETAQQGVLRASELLKQKGLRSSLFYLGQYVDKPELVERNLAAKIEVTGLLQGAGLDGHVSVDPTQTGFLLDQSWARRNAFAIAGAIAGASAARAGVHALMLDMEDSSVVDATGICRVLRGPRWIGGFGSYTGELPAGRCRQKTLGKPEKSR
jgi:proline dehydrogenase